MGQQHQPEKWYLSRSYGANPEHRQLIERIRGGVASIDDVTIRRHVESLLTSPTPQYTDEFWTLAVLEERAVSALTEALLDPRFHAPESRRYEGPFDSVLKLLDALGSEEAVPALAKLSVHPNKDVQLHAARSLGSIGKPACDLALRATLRSDDHWLREAAVDGMSNAHRLGRLSPQLAAAVFEDVVAILEKESLGGTGAPALLLLLDRERGVNYLLAPRQFRASHREISSIAMALADARVVTPVEFVLRLTDELERQRKASITALGHALQLLALTGHPSAATRIEMSMTRTGRENEYVRSLAAKAYLLLNGVPDAYHVAISAWSGGDIAALAEPIRNYATVHVLLNEVRNGSLGQYFDNSYGEDVHHAVAGFDAIGAKDAAATLRKATALLGKEGPSGDRTRRQGQLETVNRKQIVKLSDELLADRDHVEVLLARYVVRHKSYFERE
jgi:HEAT repeat protein